jgi:hypothetical protein
MKMLDVVRPLLFSVLADEIVQLVVDQSLNTQSKAILLASNVTLRSFDKLGVRPSVSSTITEGAAAGGDGGGADERAAKWRCIVGGLASLKHGK